MERPVPRPPIDVLSVTVDPSIDGLTVGVLLVTLNADAANPAVDAIVERAVATAQTWTEVESRTRAVRDLLRFGTYKPTGRGKPASEYLLGAAREGRFPRISSVVDVLNAISLTELIPISVVDVDLADTEHFHVRRGRAGEAYVFNASGQTIELEDLLLVDAIGGAGPCANPIKDSMRTKTTPTTSRALVFAVGPTSRADAVRRCVAPASGFARVGHVASIQIAHG